MLQISLKFANYKNRINRNVKAAGELVAPGCPAERHVEATLSSPESQNIT